MPYIKKEKLEELLRIAKEQDQLIKELNQLIDKLWTLFR